MQSIKMKVGACFCFVGMETGGCCSSSNPHLSFFRLVVQRVYALGFLRLDYKTNSLPWTSQFINRRWKSNTADACFYIPTYFTSDNACVCAAVLRKKNYIHIYISKSAHRVLYFLNFVRIWVGVLRVLFFGRKNSKKKKKPTHITLLFSSIHQVVINTVLFFLIYNLFLIKN